MIAVINYNKAIQAVENLDYLTAKSYLIRAIETPVSDADYYYLLALVSLAANEQKNYQKASEESLCWVKLAQSLNSAIFLLNEDFLKESYENLQDILTKKTQESEATLKTVFYENSDDLNSHREQMAFHYAKAACDQIIQGEYQEGLSLARQAREMEKILKKFKPY